MSTQSHNRRNGTIAIRIGGVIAALAVCPFVGARIEESRIIPKERYEAIAQKHATIARQCFRIEHFGTGSPAQEAEDRRCIGNKISKEKLDGIRDYNRYQTGRWYKNVVDLGLIGGGIVVGGVFVITGIGFYRG